MSVMSEPAIVPDTFVTGRLQPEDLGNGNWRMTFYVQQKSFEGVEECVVVSRLIMPSETILRLIPATMKALGYACCGLERLKLRH